jgi:hypothetical protein
MEAVFISPKSLAKRWDISIESVNHFCCNSDKLTRVRLGKRSVRFLMSEVVALEKKLVAQAKKFKAPVSFEDLLAS